jgi:hypothetical protein
MATLKLRPLFGGAIAMKAPAGLVRWRPAGRRGRPLFNSSCLADVLTKRLCLLARSDPPQIDASDIREIPDNQEVWLAPTGDESIIVEIVERQDLPEADAPGFYFGDLAQTNGADGAGLAAIEGVVEVTAANAPQLLGDARPQASGARAFVVSGWQRVAKFKEGEGARNEVCIRLAVVRLPAVGTDVLITVNAPARISAESSSAAVVAGGRGDAEAGGKGSSAGGPSGAAAGARAGAELPSGATALIPAPPAFGGLSLDALVAEMLASLVVVDYDLFDAS